MMTLEVSALTTVAFWAASALTLGLAVVVVTQRDVFRAAIALAGSFMGVGILYFILSAEFVGVVQILVYVGAISVLMAFAVMFIKDIAAGSRPSQGRLVGVVVAVLAFSALAFTAYNTEWSSMDDITDPIAVAALTEGYTERTIDGEIQVLGQGVAPDAGFDIENDGVFVDSTSAIGVSLVREYMLAFELIGLLLVAALIGGLMLMREPPEGNEPESETGGASV
jgi:NADH:ubiquinone oxidoreductase subunit 6 (subunit J)